MEKNCIFWGPGKHLHPNFGKILDILGFDSSENFSNQCTLEKLNLSPEDYKKLSDELHLDVYPEMVIYDLAQQLGGSPFFDVKIIKRGDIDECETGYSDEDEIS
jgi:hypothetical protein